ncbi:lipopolysaccharide biosynthesis protein [Capnocytophaga stomatis]|uniref:Lipopolysaccharide biosynthesis protein n=1 Tax=Capnocytophaga stomatis TaxID=1848904 RepID=A0ABW8Q903_9FLAO|nr:oligosaccharide flippase family protein [Capnocytophaga stomatis]GIJ94265.1 O-antigen export protein [Capnocytophaga stomatis]
MKQELQTRSSNYKKQVRLSFLFKVLAIGCSFFVIPLMIDYLGKEEYGIWSTLLSIVSWVILFDIGVGNGLRNKISECIVKDDFSAIKKYISTAYVIMGIGVLILSIVFVSISYLLPWQQIFNTKVLSNRSLRNVVNVTFLFTLLNFWFNLIDQIFNGMQKTSLSILNQFFKNFFILIAVFLLHSFTKGSLLNLTIIYGGVIILVNIGISIWFYEKHKVLRPEIVAYSSKYVRSITSLGVRFFVIQLAAVLLFTTDRLLITQLFGSKSVADYDVVFKLFSVIPLAHTILIAPLWSAYSDAFHQRDFNWIRQALKKQLKLFIFFAIGVIVLAFTAKFIINIWIREHIYTDAYLIITMAIFVLISIWNNIFAYFMNATNQLETQIMTSIFAVFVNIPLTILFVKYFNMGTYSVVLSSIIALSLFAFLGSRQVFKFLSNETTKS